MSPKPKNFIGVGFTSTPTKGFGPDALYPPGRSEFRVFDSQFRRVLTIKLPFIAHSYLQNPRLKTEVLALSKWGKEGAVLDLQKSSVTQILTAPVNHRFFGHAVYINEIDFLISAMEDSRHVGRLLKYSRSSALAAEIILRLARTHTIGS